MLIHSARRALLVLYGVTGWVLEVIGDERALFALDLLGAIWEVVRRRYLGG
jgi:hypothetical protein